MNIPKVFLTVICSLAVAFSGWVATQFLDLRDRMLKIETRLEILLPRETQHYGQK